jgi:hypothetical protein
LWLNESWNIINKDKVFMTIEFACHLTFLSIKVWISDKNEYMIEKGIINFYISLLYIKSKVKEKYIIQILFEELLYCNLLLSILRKLLCTSLNMQLNIISLTYIVRNMSIFFNIDVHVKQNWISRLSICCTNHQLCTWNPFEYMQN